MMRRLRTFAFLAYAIVLFIATHWPQLRVEGPVHRTDLWVHFFAFALWAMLLTASGLTGSPANPRRLPLRLAIAIGYAILDESLQAIPALGRVFALDDMAANITGATLGVLAAFAGARILAKRSSSDATDPHNTQQ
ncbi:MAG: VanZ family protein [Phycisphaerales bacterium]